MQVINVKYRDGVFVPAKPVKMTEDHEAIAIISEGRTEEAEESAKYYQDKARQHFKENFPHLDVSERILELVGILHGHKGKHDRSEYHEHIGRKYK